MSADILLRAPFFHTPSSPFRTANALRAEEDGGLLIRDGIIIASGSFADVRSQAGGVESIDLRGGYILPGFIDTHVHYPQLRIIGGLGRTLLDWLEHIALPEEARMADESYADETARRFVHALASHGTTTALVFGSHFAGATASLFDAARVLGLRLISGLVLSDRALRVDLHQSPDAAYQDSRVLIDRFHKQGRLLYAVTPRFALSASEAMLEVCQSLVHEHDELRVQTHINEQPDEVASCLRAFPWARDYLSIYDRYSLKGPRTVLAHSVQTTDPELDRMASEGTSVAHCPCSNAALGSGIFPLERHITAGVHVALGTDVGGGTGFGMLKEALQAYLMQRVSPRGMMLSPAHLLYLSTRAGAEALGLGHTVGDLSHGHSADLVYIKPKPDTTLAGALAHAERMEDALAAIMTMGDSASIEDVRVAGDVIYRRQNT